VPTNWKVLLVVITLALTASVVIGSYRLVTTPTEIFGTNFVGLPKSDFPR
jgi:hypothetical protein